MKLPKAHLEEHVHDLRVHIYVYMEKEADR